MIGVNKLADLVGVTLGPKGRNVVLESKYGSPKIVNDGVTVAKEVELEDAVENIGAKLVRQAAAKTNDLAGDGTTTSVVLAQGLITEGVKELHEFLKDLTDWEQTVKIKEKKLASGTTKDSGLLPVRGQAQIAQGEEDDNKDTGGVGDDKPLKKAAGSSGHTYDYFRNKWDNFDVEAALKEVDEEPAKKAHSQKPMQSVKRKSVNTKGKLPDISQKPTTLPKSSSNKSSSSLGAAAATIDRMSNVFGLDEPVPDAWSEKDLGNKYFKEGKYVQAIDCYSRSIALQPTALAFANRAMALLKIRRYADAEVDCTEAIELDDHYTKATMLIDIPAERTVCHPPVKLRQIIAYSDTISATTIQGTEDAICLEKTTDGLL